MAHSQNLVNPLVSAQEKEEAALLEEFARKLRLIPVVDWVCMPVFVCIGNFVSFVIVLHHLVICGLLGLVFGAFTILRHLCETFQHVKAILHGCAAFIGQTLSCVNICGWQVESPIAVPLLLMNSVILLTAFVLPAIIQAQLKTDRFIGTATFWLSLLFIMNMSIHIHCFSSYLHETEGNFRHRRNPTSPIPECRIDTSNTYDCTDKGVGKFEQYGLTAGPVVGTYLSNEQMNIPMKEADSLQELGDLIAAEFLEQSVAREGPLAELDSGVRIYNINFFPSDVQALDRNMAWQSIIKVTYQTNLGLVGGVGGEILNTSSALALPNIMSLLEDDGEGKAFARVVRNGLTAVAYTGAACPGRVFFRICISSMARAYLKIRNSDDMAKALTTDAWGNLPALIAGPLLICAVAVTDLMKENSGSILVMTYIYRYIYIDIYRYIDINIYIYIYISKSAAPVPPNFANFHRKSAGGRFFFGVDSSV